MAAWLSESDADAIIDKSKNQEKCNVQGFIKTARVSINRAAGFLPIMLGPRDPPTTCFPTRTPQPALFITTDTDFPYFAPTACLRPSPSPFPCVVCSSLTGSQVCRVVLVAASTIPDPHRTTVFASHDAALSIRGRHQAVPHKEGHSQRLPLQGAVWVSPTKSRNTLCYFVSTRGRWVPDTIGCAFGCVMPVVFGRVITR